VIATTDGTSAASGVPALGDGLGGDGVGGGAVTVVAVGWAADPVAWADLGPGRGRSAGDGGWADEGGVAETGGSGDPSSGRSPRGAVGTLPGSDEEGGGGTVASIELGEASASGDGGAGGGADVDVVVGAWTPLHVSRPESVKPPPPAGRNFQS
jgi:hypothetical protein